MSADRSIYVDLDDVLSQTIRGLVELLDVRFGKRVVVENVVHFDLGRSFGLEDADLHEFLDAAHEPAVLGSLLPNDGAAHALERWTASGYAVSVLTGRPPSTRPTSARWLEAHAMPHAELAFVDKYGRRVASAEHGLPLTLDEVAEREFALAVEDSLEVAAFLAERLDMEVALFDRPWNRDICGLSPKARRRIVRCHSWQEIACRFPAP